MNRQDQLGLAERLAKFAKICTGNTAFSFWPTPSISLQKPS